LLVEGDDEFEVSVDLLSRQKVDDWDPQAPIGTFSVRALAFEGREDRSVRGPRGVRIELADANGTMVEVEYEIEYDRDEDFYGDERCGFCEHAQSRTSAWVP
jgi:hypothetical protein